MLAALLHPAQSGTDVIFLPHAGLGPLDGGPMITGERLDPTLIIVGPRREHLLADGRNSRDLVEEMDHLFGTR